jgi:hypothetical protein
MTKPRSNRIAAHVESVKTDRMDYGDKPPSARRFLSLLGARRDLNVGLDARDRYAAGDRRLPRSLQTGAPVRSITRVDGFFSRADRWLDAQRGPGHTQRDCGPAPTILGSAPTKSGQA